MPNKSKQKGTRYESHIVNTLKDHGIEAQRVPLSGSAGGDFGGDIHAKILGRKWMIENKKGNHVPKFCYRHLTGVDALVMARDREMDLVVLPWNVFLDIIKERKG